MGVEQDSSAPERSDMVEPAGERWQASPRCGAQGVHVVDRPALDPVGEQPPRSSGRPRWPRTPAPRRVGGLLSAGSLGTATGRGEAPASLSLVANETRPERALFLAPQPAGVGAPNAGPERSTAPDPCMTQVSTTSQVLTLWRRAVDRGSVFSRC